VIARVKMRGDKFRERVDFDKDYKYAICGVAFKKQLRYIHKDDLRTYRSIPLWKEWELEE
jgi:hypothetical protein